MRPPTPSFANRSRAVPLLKSWAMRLAKRAGRKRPRWRLGANSPSSCIACWRTVRRLRTSRRSVEHRNGGLRRRSKSRAFGGQDTRPPWRGPDAGTMDQVRPNVAWWHRPRLSDWLTCPLQTPSGGGFAPTPDRSTTPAKGFLANGKCGIDNARPVSQGRHAVRGNRRGSSGGVAGIDGGRTRGRLPGRRRSRPSRGRSASGGIATARRGQRPAVAGMGGGYGRLPHRRPKGL